ncbi:hypothetical protein JTB14_026764 [Gonioctena quinquepunctata]|nr:hypothetical protein JTB14_026764 [Gonioctena quinquepunctata]
MDLSQYRQESVPDENSEKESGKSEDEHGTIKNKSPAKMRPPAMPMKRANKQASGKSTSEINEAINQPDKIAQNAAEEKPYEQFGKFVASELRQLPQRQAILLQKEIQNCVIRSKLASVDHVVVDGAFSSSSNHSLSSNNDDDVLQKVMINTFVSNSML